MKTRTIKQLVYTILAVTMLLPMKALSATLSIEDFTIKGGETKTMLIDVNNPDMAVTMVEFYMHLPNGLNVATEDGELAVDIAGRTTWKKHSLEAQLNSGVLHVFLYSGSNTALTGTSGAVISVKLTAASSFNGGTITLKQQLLTSPDETESKPADYTYTVTTGVVADDVTLMAKSYTRVYGEANPTFGYEVTSGSITSGTPTITCSATKTSPVGTYPIVISKGSVTNSTVNLVNGTLTITKAPLTISAGNYTKVEGEANPTFTPSFSGFKNNETKSVLTKQPTITCSATTSSPAGTYPVTVSGAEAQNYSFTYVNGTLTVTTKESVKGDVNGDGAVNVADIASVIDVMAMGGGSPFADVNGDGAVNVADIATIIDIMAGGSSSHNKDIITFADPEVKRICVENWDTDGNGELSKDEAKAVTDIGKAFYDNQKITSFDELQYFTGLTGIADEAFYYCSMMLSITIPNSVKAIGNYSFQYCWSLTSIDLPQSLTSIGRYAFSYTDLASITIPSSVKDISTNPFAYISKLATIKVENGNTVFDSRDNCNAIIDTKTNKLITGCKNTVIPNSVTIIGTHAFGACKDLTSVIIPNSVTSINYGAFISCGLTSVTIPNLVTAIEDYAFYYCNNLKEVHSMIKKPFAIKNNIFYYYNNGTPSFTTATLYVPKGTKSLYEATDGWKNFTNIVEEGGNMAPTGAEAIDLGLPSGTKWANMNVGAEQPEDYGLYFAWGETQGYGSDTSDGRLFNNANYKWYDSDSKTYTKYVSIREYGSTVFGAVDSLSVLLPEDDAATVNWGDNWRMPTKEECQELIDNCTVEETTFTVSGSEYRKILKFTSKVNGKYILLPKAGYRNEWGVVDARFDICYWSSSLVESWPMESNYLLGTTLDYINVKSNLRCRGYSVRAVRK